MSKEKYDNNEKNSFSDCVKDNFVDAMKQANDNCHAADSDCKTMEASSYIAENCIEKDCGGRDSDGGDKGDCTIF